jgi:hypothetical protein
MGGGNNAQTQSTQLAQQQTQTGTSFLNLAQQSLASSQQLEQPLINLYSELTSGQPGAVQTALSPQIGHISQNTQQAEANVMRNVAPGAGADAALAQARIQQGQQTAQTENAGINNAFTGLAQIGAQQAGVGLSEAGTGLSGMAGAQQAYGVQQQLQAQQKSSLMGTIGSIVGGTSSGLATAASNNGWFNGSQPTAPTLSLSQVAPQSYTGGIDAGPIDWGGVAAGGNG